MCVMKMKVKMKMWAAAGGGSTVATAGWMDGWMDDL